MKTTLKLALSLLIGATVLTACDNQDSKTSEKSTALSENTPTQTVTTETKEVETTASENSEVVAENKSSSQDEQPVEQPKADVQKVETVEVVKSENLQDKTISEKTVNEQVSQKQETKTVTKTAKTSPQSSYLKEQQALLKVLEKQYEEVRCTPEAEKLGENSFCRQEERRLFLEIERVKDEIRLNL